MALGKAVVGEGSHLDEDLLGDVTGDAALGHAGEQPLLQLLHPLVRALRAHRLAELIGLGRREAGDVDRHLHQLLLEQRHAERLGQRALEQRMEVGGLFAAVAATDVGMNRAALDRPGTDQRDFDDKVVEFTRPQAGQRRHLRTRLDLEHADRVGGAQHVVDGLFLRDGCQIDLVAAVLTHEVDGVVQRRQHPQTE